MPQEDGVGRPRSQTQESGGSVDARRPLEIPDASCPVPRRGGISGSEHGVDEVFIRGKGERGDDRVLLIKGREEGVGECSPR